MQEPENQQPSSETNASHAEEEKQPIHRHAAERAQHRRQKKRATHDRVDSHPIIVLYRGVFLVNITCETFHAQKRDGNAASFFHGDYTEFCAREPCQRSRL